MITRPRLAIVFGALAASTVTLAAGDACAWQQTMPFTASVNGHEFDRVVLRGDGCKVHVELYFSAPAAAYESRAKQRNVHRFVVRVQLADGNALRIGPFTNTAAGPRRHRASQDTSARGCWAKGEPQVRSVNVNGCRGKGCRVPELD
jgi:hypothetical protein